MNQGGSDLLAALKESLDLIDQMIREGRMNEAHRALDRISIKALNRGLAARFANLARRLMKPQLAVRALHPIIRGEFALSEPPTDFEKAEYGVALLRLGAIPEALELLNDVSPAKVPMVHLYRAFCHFNRWNYLAGLQCLEFDLSKLPVDDYQKNTIRVNRAAAKLWLADLDGLEYELLDLQETLGRNNQRRLQSNVFEMLAQNYIQTESWDKSADALRRSMELIDSNHRMDTLFIRKWQAISQALRDRDPTALGELRTEALAAGHWETVRDVDHYRLQIEPDRRLFEYLYFGTPHHSFRHRLEHGWRSEFAIPEYAEVGGGTAPSRVWNPFEPGKDWGSLSHRLNLVLLQDLYQPRRVGEIFSMLFQNEYFNPDSSVNRVHQAVRRLKEFMRENQVPASIESIDGLYRLQIAPDIAVGLYRRFPVARDPFYRWRLNQFAPHESRDHGISRDQVENLLAISTSKAKEWIRRGREEGWIETFGAGSNTRYFIHSPFQSADQSQVRSA